MILNCLRRKTALLLTVAAVTTVTLFCGGINVSADEADEPVIEDIVNEDAGPAAAELFCTGTTEAFTDLYASVTEDEGALQHVTETFDGLLSAQADLCITVDNPDAVEIENDCDLKVTFTDEELFARAAEDQLYFTDGTDAYIVPFEINNEEYSLYIKEIPGPGTFVFTSGAEYEDPEIADTERDPEYDPALVEELAGSSSSVSLESALTYPYIAKGDTIHLAAIVSPSGAAKNLKWTSSAPNIAKVNSKGAVYGVSKGSAVITASLNDGSGANAKYRINVVSYKDTGAECIAHRGFRRAAPENTRPAFELAVKAGYDGIECDIFKTKDDVFVVSHDDRLIRIFDKEIYITQNNWKDLSKLVAVKGHGVKNFPNEHLLKFEDYLNIVSGSYKNVVIEVKELFDQEHTDKLYEMVSSYGMNDRVRFVTGRAQLERLQKSIDKYKEEYPEGPTLMVAKPTEPDVPHPTYGNISAIEYASLHGYGLFIRKDTVSTKIIKKAHDANVIVCVWDVTDPDEAYYLANDMNVDQVVCNADLTHAYFEDVPVTHSFYQSVYWAAEKGIAAGYTDGSGDFGVNDKVLRGQVVTFLWRMAGRPEPSGKKQTFKDVPVKHSYYKAIQWAYEKGITTGYHNGNFGVNDSCTRGQIAMFLWRYSGKPSPEGKTKTFSDVPVKHAFYKAIQWASENRITAGYSNGKFGVSDTCTRGQCVTFLYRTGS